MIQEIEKTIAGEKTLRSEKEWDSKSTDSSLASTGTRTTVKCMRHYTKAYIPIITITSGMC